MSYSYSSRPPPWSITQNNTFVSDVENFMNGFTDSGVYYTGYDYIILTADVLGTTYYYACNAYQIIYGGPDSNGGVDGTDPTAVWQAALTDGGTIYIAAGTYEVTTLTGGSDTTIIGAGASVATLIQADGTNSNVLTFDGESNIRISRLTVDGDKDNNPSGDNGINFNDCHNIIIDDVVTKNNYLKGIALSGCYDVWIENSETHDNESDGYVIASITPNGNNSYNCYIVNCHIHDNGAYGIGVITPTATDKNPYDIFILGNYIRDPIAGDNLNGVQLKGCNRVTVSNNHIKAMQVGIFAGDTGYTASNTVIEGNTIWNCLGNGIELKLAEYTLVNGNKIYDDQTPKTQDRSIYEHAACSYNTITNNDVRDNTNLNASMYLLGSYTTVKNNSGFPTKLSGTAEASNNDAISFADGDGLRFPVAPYCVVVTVNESDARYIAQAHSMGVSQFVLYLYDETAGAFEGTDKTISWVAYSTGVS